MSLIRIRRERKKNWIDQKASWSPRRLMILFILLVAAIWYLGYRFSTRDGSLPQTNFDRSQLFMRAELGL